MLSVSSVILAGGQSQRMGVNKAFLEFEGHPLIARVIDKVSQVGDEVILVTNAPDEYAHLGHRLVTDVFPGKGSLGGIYTGVKAARNPYTLVVACDMPFLNPSLLRYMILLSPGYDVVVPRLGREVEPLHALYAKACLPAMEAVLQQDNLQIIAFYSQVRVRYVEQQEIEILDPNHFSLFNVNSPQDLEQAKRIVADVDAMYRRSKRAN